MPQGTSNVEAHMVRSDGAGTGPAAENRPGVSSPRPKVVLGVDDDASVLRAWGHGPESGTITLGAGPDDPDVTATVA